MVVGAKADAADFGKGCLWIPGGFFPARPSTSLHGCGMVSNRNITTKYGFGSATVSGRRKCGAQLPAWVSCAEFICLLGADWKASWLKSSKIYSGSDSSRFRKDLK